MNHRLAIAIVVCALLPSLPVQARLLGDDPVLRVSLTTEPKLGEHFEPPKSKTRSLLMTSSANLQDGPYPVRWNDIEYDLALDGEGRISWVSTDDRAFRSPEGVAVGDSMQTVIACTGASLRTEPGWAYFVQLPSGWCATVAPTLTPEGKIDVSTMIPMHGKPAPTEGTVASLFIRK